MVHDLRTQTGAPSKACLMEPQHRKQAFFDSESICEPKILSFPRETFAKQVNEDFKVEITDVKKKQGYISSIGRGHKLSLEG